MAEHWTLSVHRGHPRQAALLAEWRGPLPLSWRVLMCIGTRPIYGGPGGPGTVEALSADFQSGVARFRRLALLLLQVPGQDAPGMMARLKADETRLMATNARDVLLRRGGDGTAMESREAADLRRLCVETGRLISALQRDGFTGPRRFANVARAGRGPFAMLRGIRLDETYDDPSGPDVLPLGLVFSSAAGSDI